MTSWERHIREQEVINEGVFLDELQRACEDFCNLLIGEFRRIAEFDREHAQA